MFPRRKDVMSEAEMRDIWLAEDDETLKKGCIIDFHKCSGNGGQKVNKTSSAVRLIHQASGLSAEDTKERSQVRNLSNALKKLRLRIALKIRNPITEKSPLPVLSPPPSMTNVKVYSTALALMLDRLMDRSWDIPAAAEVMNISKTKLTKLIFRDPAFLLEVNRGRSEKGLPPLQNPVK